MKTGGDRHRTHFFADVLRHAALPAARRGPGADYNLLDRRFQLYLVGDNFGNNTHDHNQVSTGTACALPPTLHTTPPSSCATLSTSLTSSMLSRSCSSQPLP
jgi:hypothetical protein